LRILSWLLPISPLYEGEGILKPVWFLAFQKPNPGCSYPRTKGAEDFTRAKLFFGFSKTILR
jgi:hypothetical protein